MRERAKGIVRRIRKEATQQQWRKSKTIRWVIGVALTLAIAALFPRAHSTSLSGYSVGSLWTSDDVRAPFGYPILKDKHRYDQDVQKALGNLYPVYVPDTEAREASLTNLRERLGLLRQFLDLGHKDSLEEFALIDSAKVLGIDKEGWSGLLAATRQGQSPRGHFATSAKLNLEELEPTLIRLVGNLASNALIVRDADRDATTGGQRAFSLRVHPTQEVVLSKDSLVSLEDVQNRIYAQLEAQKGLDVATLRAISKLAGGAIHPTVSYSETLTEENRQALMDRVPRSDGIIMEGQRIVSRGDVISPSVKASLESLSQARLDRGGWLGALAQFIGTIGHAGIMVLLLVLYLKFIRRKIYNDNAQLLLMSVILLLPALLAFITLHIHVNFPLEYFILLPVSSMLLTVVFDSRTGFYGTVVAALIVAGIRGNDYTVALAALTAGAFAAYTVRDLRSRAQLFQSIGYIALGYVVAIIALALEQSTPSKELGMMVIASIGNAIVSPVLTFGLLFIIELVFDTMSDLRLTEFDNINHPLLRELALRAPGTYQHTMLVAQLSENAAIAIGANALLAKVGAYFHDIGKLTEPTDFIENQPAESVNVHTQITPLESVERIRNHVVLGIELAMAHHLPEKLIEFIPMHHGTQRISFFYDQALAQLQPGEHLDEALFRYPGPIPNSKETAIVMISDAAEAVARTVAANVIEPTPEAIEEAIDKLIRNRLQQGQLDNCDLTMRDLTVMRTVYARLLIGLHHTRLNYPLPSEKPRKAAKQSQAPKAA